MPRSELDAANVTAQIAAWWWLARVLSPGRPTGYGTRLVLNHPSGLGGFHRRKGIPVWDSWATASMAV